jgi:hypothetical protein
MSVSVVQPDFGEKRLGDDVSELPTADYNSLGGEDVLSLQDLDPALNKKMHLVNNVSDPRNGCELCSKS